MMFDRVILLSEGYTLYTGPPQMVAKYFKQFGFEMPRFANPSDKLLQIATEPARYLDPNITIVDLHDSCKT